MNKFRLEIRSKVLTAIAVGPSVAPRWDCPGHELKLGWTRSRAMCRGGWVPARSQQPDTGPFPPPWAFPPGCTHLTLARLWCPAAKTFVLCTGWGTCNATQEHSLPAPVPLQRGWDPLLHPEGTGRGHLLLSSLAQGHWEAPLWSCSQRRAGSLCVPELLHGDSSVCLLPPRISLSLAPHCWMPSKPQGWMTLIWLVSQ